MVGEKGCPLVVPLVVTLDAAMEDAEAAVAVEAVEELVAVDVLLAVLTVLADVIAVDSDSAVFFRTGDVG